MKDETRVWLRYAEENLQSAVVLSESELFNPCLQNVQQSVEKALKALLIENVIKLKRTHGILELRNILLRNKIEIDISEDDCEFLDSIYLPSKYPLGNALPFYQPDQKICTDGILIAENVLKFVKKKL